MTLNIKQPHTEFTIDATQVARRSLIVAAVACRGLLDSHAGEPETTSLCHRIPEWLTNLDLWDAAEASEKMILHTPLGKLEQQAVLQASWYIEGLAILAWALNQLEFPRHDQQVDPHDVADSVWFLSEDSEELIRTATLRSTEELATCRELLYAIHSRLRDYLRNKQKKDFTRWIEQKWISELHIDVAHLFADQDLAIDDRVITDVEDDRLLECELITRERHRAIIWLVERNSTYSQTSVDT